MKDLGKIGPAAGQAVGIIFGVIVETIFASKAYYS
jgi:hypothetical protein